MQRAELMNATKEEQIVKKQQILEELQKVGNLLLDSVPRTSAHRRAPPSSASAAAADAASVNPGATMAISQSIRWFCCVCRFCCCVDYQFVKVVFETDRFVVILIVCTRSFKMWHCCVMSMRFLTSQVEHELQAKAKLHRILSSSAGAASRDDGDGESSAALERLKSGDPIVGDGAAAAGHYAQYEHLHNMPKSSTDSESGKFSSRVRVSFMTVPGCHQIKKNATSCAKYRNYWLSLW